MCSCLDKSLAKVNQIERENVLKENQIRVRLEEKPYRLDSTIPSVRSMRY